MRQADYLDREGLGNADELMAEYQRKAATITNPPYLPFHPPPPPPHQAEGNTFKTERPSTTTSNPPGVKTLSSYIDIPKTLELPQEEIEYIWRLRHASDPQSLCAVIPKSTHNRILKTATEHPQFILPLPREGRGAEIHFLEWTFPTPKTATVLFTHFAEYRLRGEYSQPHTIVTHHMDLAEPKGLVLLQGNVVEGRGITVDDGKWLLMCLQKFYGGDGLSGVRKKLLEQFTRGDLRFEVDELLKEAEKII
ncbi:hypothetical protein MMC29_006652 [Sticta canariensis]|nr:hypothetical protein [Sticta canariensis]